MLYDDAQETEYYLWCLMIAEPYQRKGYERKAIELLINYVKSRPCAKELITSYVPKESGPEEFYKTLGYMPTGEVGEGEVMVRLNLCGERPALQISQPSGITG